MPFDLIPRTQLVIIEISFIGKSYSFHTLPCKPPRHFVPTVCGELHQARRSRRKPAIICVAYPGHGPTRHMSLQKYFTFPLSGKSPNTNVSDPRRIARHYEIYTRLAPNYLFITDCLLFWRLNIRISFLSSSEGGKFG